MPRLTTAIWASLWGLLLLALLPRLGLAAGLDQPIGLSADHFDGSMDLDTHVAEGHAVLTYANMSLHADRIVWTRSTGEVVASGHLSLVQEEWRLLGEVLHFNVNTNEGSLTKARAFEEGIILRGDRIDFSPQELVAHEASLTTCTRPDPDYVIAAGTITLTALHPPPGAAPAPGQKAPATPTAGRVTLKGGRVIYHGRRVLPLPGYSFTVGEMQKHAVSLLPTSGFDHADGPFLSSVHTLGPPDAKIVSHLGVRLTNQRGVRGVLESRRKTGPVEFFANITRREDSGDSDLGADQVSYSTRSVLLNREPEIGVKLTDLALGPRFRLGGEVSVGRFSELDSATRAVLARDNRVSVTAFLRTTPYPISPRIKLTQVLGVRESFYSGGEDLAIGYFRNTVEFGSGQDRRYALSYVRRLSSGGSPFVFDAPGISHELRADVQYRLNPDWRAHVIEMYDLDQGRTRDMQVSAVRTVHCLDYTLGWRKLRGTIFFGVNLVPASGSEADAVAAGFPTLP